jgi:hypothetical protein
MSFILGLGAGKSFSFGRVGPFWREVMRLVGSIHFGGKSYLFSLAGLVHFGGFSPT